jgi:hypothetical protein
MAAFLPVIGYPPLCMPSAAQYQAVDGLSLLYETTFGISAGLGILSPCLAVTRGFSNFHAMLLQGPMPTADTVHRLSRLYRPWRVWHTRGMHLQQGEETWRQLASSG